MLPTIALAFIAGVITILSPCVLPLLPMILATATQQGKARPTGVIVGFVLAFTAATLALSALVRLLGVPPDINRTLSAVILALLGLVLIIPGLQLQFERLAGGLAGRAPSSDGTGFGGGVVVGVGLGLAWSPCVGPIMASVITLALNQSVGPGAIAVTLAFSLGTALPMAAVLFGGRQLVRRLDWFQRHAATIQRVFGLVLLLTALAIWLGWDRTLQILLLEWFPGWEGLLTSWEPQAVDG
ncbi:MAG TPA: cytochrome c biogenesis CcdA family protein [Devosia sp.]|jgi:cytochrome c biogenesis protein CcdA|uniref:cytochrome c biogenesis CcdA family protein n=1 Tax=Devosia sp. TaxID=1871048 RepID=UPI002DDDA7D9|nr:cytochrome c biogenesis CcdA family protein [Devosia sp.]HEV2515291.1 cytochrome c biogenesis CcdA family protein [Devosia sp.]